MDRKSIIVIAITSLFLVGIFVFIGRMIATRNQMEWPFILLVEAFVLATPLFLTAGIFSAYRRFYLSEYPDRQAHVSWNDYVLPMAIFILTVTIITTGIVFWDSRASAYYAEKLSESQGRNVAPSLIVGRSSVPIGLTLKGSWQVIGNERQYVIEETTIRVPTTIFWFAYIGALVSIVSSIMYRFVIKHLISRTYLNSTLRVLYAMVATLLLYIFVQAWPEFVGQTNVDPLEKSHMVVLFAFLAGMFPWETIQRIAGRLRSMLGLGGRLQLPLTEIQGIDSTVAVFLNEEGVWSVADLAARSPVDVAQSTHLDPRVVGKWHNQARLYVQLGDLQVIRRLRRLGINEWDDLAFLEDVEIEVRPDELTRFVSEGRQLSTVLFKVLQKKYQEGAGE
jgi:hypothetical protein